jgi:hypothetical protein
VTRRLRSSLLVSVALGLLAIVALLLAASRQMPVRSYDLNAPNQTPVGTLRPGGRVCEGPVIPAADTRVVAIWGQSTSPSATVRIEVEDARTRRLLAARRVVAGSVPNAAVARLGSDIPARQPLTICVADEAGGFSLWGSAASHPGIVMTGTSGSEFSLVLISAATHTFVGSLGLAFSRAALWRPSWVGPWTYWVFLFALLALFGVSALAIARASTEDEATPHPGAISRPLSPSHPAAAPVPPTAPASVPGSPRAAP